MINRRRLFEAEIPDELYLGNPNELVTIPGTNQKVERQFLPGYSKKIKTIKKKKKGEGGQVTVKTSYVPSNYGNRSVWNDPNSLDSIDSEIGKDETPEDPKATAAKTFLEKINNHFKYLLREPGGKAEWENIDDYDTPFLQAREEASFIVDDSGINDESKRTMLYTIDQITQDRRDKIRKLKTNGRNPDAKVYFLSWLTGDRKWTADEYAFLKLASYINQSWLAKLGLTVSKPKRLGESQLEQIIRNEVKKILKENKHRF
jgi:hypothetical protein